MSSGIDRIARGLAGGMSRRDALRAGASAMFSGIILDPADAFAAVTGHCPKHHVRCAGKCCPKGEACLPPKHKGGKRHCGCAHHKKRCHGKCVAVQSDPKNCGTCGRHCGSNQLCSRGQCVSHCPSGDTQCGASCVNVHTDPANCGSCGHHCGAEQVCSNGACLTVCAGGQTNCNGSCVSLSTDPQNCGSCSAACSSSGTTSVACASGVCQVTCASGFGNCNGNGRDGCETNVNTSVDHCGTCNHSCLGGSHVMSATCVGGGCVLQCDAGFWDCNSDPTDGCECAGTGCCSGGNCQTNHSNGVGGHYFDCVAAGTYNLTQALEACNSDAAQTGDCSDGWTSGSGANVQTAVCKPSVPSGTSGTCTCWAYKGTGTASSTIGHVDASASNGCVAPAPTDPIWT